MRSIAFADFLIGLGILFVLEGLMFAASPAWMRRAMKSAMATPDNILRAVGIGSAVVGLLLIWLVPGSSAAERSRSHPRSPGMTKKVACGINEIVSRRRPVFRRNARLKCLRLRPVRAHCGPQIDPFGEKLT